MVNNIEHAESENEPISVGHPEEEALLPKSENGQIVNDQVPNGGAKHIPSEDKTYESTSPVEEKNPEQPPVRRISEIAKELYESGETACGIWCLQGDLLQRFANKKMYVILYGVLGSIMSASYAYLNGTITTIEKRFKIPTTNTGIIMVGCDITQLLLCLFLNYYGGRGHRPRWIAFGVYTVVAFCVMNALPHFLYGPGLDSLALTEEYGAHHDENITTWLIDSHNRKVLCQEAAGECDDASGNFAPQVILFSAQLISGIGGSLYYTLGVSYMDDNIKKSKTPALVSLSYFLRMLGPACGYALASACLSMYISPSLTPTIQQKDPRWLGAWWLGWLVIGSLLLFSASIVALFPKALPRAAARKVLASERRKAGLNNEDENDPEQEMPTSFKDLKITFLRLIKNPTLMCNNFANVFYFMGYMPYWIFMPKYIETIYKQSAAFSSFLTGTVGLAFSALGILASGIFISKFRPSARFLAAWNVVVGAITVMCIITYAFLDCPINDRQGQILASGQMEMKTECNNDCNCDYIKYSPVCSPDGRTFISPCHAGCRSYQTLTNGSKVYSDCACVPRPAQALALEGSNLTLTLLDTENQSKEDEGPVMEEPEDPWLVREGPCPVDCSTKFYIFLAVVCIFKFSGATGRTSNFLVGVRCVDAKDKTVAMGLGLMFMSMFAFLPSPILFGYFIDKTCMVWGKTCTGTGNCWLYNGEMLRYILNFTAAGFVTVGTFFDLGVWFHVKDLKIFDEEVELELSPQRAKTQRK